VNKYMKDGTDRLIDDLIVNVDELGFMDKIITLKKQILELSEFVKKNTEKLLDIDKRLSDIETERKKRCKAK